MSIPPTQLTLLARLRDPADDLAWRRFEAAYRDLIVRFAVRQGLQAADAEDVAQAVFAAMASALKGFTLDPARGRFRDYLFRAARNEIVRSKMRATRPTGAASTLLTSDLAAVAAPDAGDPPEERVAFENEWINHHYRTALHEIRTTHAAESVAIFEWLIQGQSVESTAAAFATTSAAVHKVKQRMRDRMRELIEKQIAEEDG